MAQVAPVPSYAWLTDRSWVGCSPSARAGRPGRFVSFSASYTSRVQTALGGRPAEAGRGTCSQYGVVLQRLAVPSAKVRVVRAALELLEQVRRDDVVGHHAPIVPHGMDPGTDPVQKSAEMRINSRICGYHQRCEFIQRTTALREPMRCSLPRGVGIAESGPAEQVHLTTFYADARRRARARPRAPPATSNGAGTRNAQALHQRDGRIRDLNAAPGPAERRRGGPVLRPARRRRRRDPAPRPDRPARRGLRTAAGRLACARRPAVLHRDRGGEPRRRPAPAHPDPAAQGGRRPGRAARPGAGRGGRVQARHRGDRRGRPAEGAGGPPDRPMESIVQTIQADQDRIIRSELPGILVVQGGPGTGKTAIALAPGRISALHASRATGKARNSGRRAESDVPEVHRPGAAVARRGRRPARHRRRAVPGPDRDPAGAAPRAPRSRAAR